MDIVIAAEKSTIAKLLGDHIHRRVSPEEIEVSENPEETGSFYIGLDFDHYTLSPSGQIMPDELQLVD
ncbi:MAG: hypothetical protein ACR2RD_13080 [Woeseiaceae bacterium]